MSRNWPSRGANEPFAVSEDTPRSWRRFSLHVNSFVGILINISSSILKTSRQISIVNGMKWVLGGLVLLGIGALLRRLLRMAPSAAPRLSGLIPLRPELHAVYHPVAQEVETQAAILGISLNDAFEERDASRHDMAWHMIRLSAGEWDRLAEIVTALLNALAKYLTSARVVVPVRSIVADRFKSRVMIDYVRMHELLDQLVFSSKLRFQLQIRLLRRAAAALTGEFRHTYRYAERSEDRSPEVWSRFDLYFHDFDLIAKETLLAFRALVACLSPEAIPDLSADLHTLVQRGVRAPSLPASR